MKKQILPELWAIAKDGEAAVKRLYSRHYSCRHYKDNRKTKKIVGPGEYLILITPQENALFVWRKFKSRDNQQGVNCAVFRNEGRIQSSLLIKEAMYLAWQKWPGERLYTYVNSQKIKSTNPGYCFLQAGWKKCGMTKIHKLIILECYADQRTD